MKTFNLINYVLITILFLPITVFADDGLQLTSIPFVTQGGLSGVIQGLFLLAIVVAGMLAVVKLVIAGAKYMMSDVVTTKQSAIGDIKGAIIGLLLILGTVLILDTINDQITNANLSLESLNLEGSEWSFEDPTIPCQGIEDCEVITCEFWRDPLADTWCSDWCENRNGLHIDNVTILAGEFDTHQCALRPTEEIDCYVRPAPGTGNAIAECGAAIDECEADGGYYVDQVNGSTPEDTVITCRPPYN